MTHLDADENEKEFEKTERLIEKLKDQEDKQKEKIEQQEAKNEENAEKRVEKIDAANAALDACRLQAFVLDKGLERFRKKHDDAKGRLQAIED